MKKLGEIKMKKSILMSLSLCVLVALLTGPAAAVPVEDISFVDPVEDTFFIKFDGAGELVASDSGGSGYDGGAWYYYPNTDWWNQWFYDDPFDPDASKLIDVWMTITPTMRGAWADIAINWSTALYPSNPDSPPPPSLTPEDEEAWIFRELIFFDEKVYEPVNISLELPIVIPDYNPEWVSIDIRGANITVTSGVIRHECIPEPATMALLGFGSLVFLRKRRA